MSGERTILITGAAKGIGRAMALHLAGSGTRLLLHYNSSGQAALEVAQEAEALGATVELVQADLALCAEREAMMDRVDALTHTLHVLINNAGIYDGRELPEFSAKDWQRIFDVGCSAVFHIIQRAIPLLRKGAPARVINLGDSGADRIVARTTATPYHVAKLGVHVLTRSYAKLLAPERITVNQISPGFMENSHGEPVSPMPSGRKGTVDDLLPALDYLLSSGADYVTSANIVVSGGWNQ